MSPFGDDEPERRPNHRVPEADETVRHVLGPNAEYVRDLLKHLQRYDWPGAPRHLGVDEQGYDVFLRYPGLVASAPFQPPAVWSDASLARVARLLRQLHDLTVGTACAGDAEVACHNDVTPGNTVYRETPDGLRPCGFVNWEFAGPGRRVHDLAYACWRFLDLGPARSEPTGPARLMRLMCDSYELGRNDRAELVDTVLWWQERILTEERQRLGLLPSSAGQVEAFGQVETGGTGSEHEHTGEVPFANVAEGMPGTELPEASPLEALPEAVPLEATPEVVAPDHARRADDEPDARPFLDPDEGLSESIADIQAAIDWVREYADILDAVVTARNPPRMPDDPAFPPPIANPPEPPAPAD